MFDLHFYTNRLGRQCVSMTKSNGTRTASIELAGCSITLFDLVNKLNGFGANAEVGQGKPSGD